MRRSAVVILILAAGAGPAPPDNSLPAAGSLGGPDRALSSDEGERWLRGRALFLRDVEVRNGLGPLFDADSCRACHCRPVTGGAGGLDAHVVLFGRLNGSEFTTYPGGLEATKLSTVGTPRREIPFEANIIEQRQPPLLLGMGLVDRIPDDVILANADPDDADGNGLSGRPNMIDGVAGRFGLKASVPTLRDMVAYMSGREIGLTLPNESSDFAVTSDNDSAADPELSADEFDDLVFYASHLAPPLPATGGDAIAIARGREVFEQIGCSACHIPSLNSADGPVNAYSDFLLHEITLAAAANIVQGISTPTEFRTAPLWGLRYTAPYLYNGAAETIRDAILAHFGEAQFTQDRFFFLPPSDSAALITFLESL